MKILVLLLLMILSVNNYHAQEVRETETFKNRAFRIYAALGSGVPIVNHGIGLSYAYETGGALSKSFFGWSVDTQVGFTGAMAKDGFINFKLSFNVQSSIGVGRRYKNGGRFFYDIIGLGYSLSYQGVPHDFIGKQEPSIAKSGILVNAFSFHYTDSSGFYFSWRNNFTFPLINETSHFMIEWRTYLTFGFDFSKIYNPKIYRRRES